MLRPKMQNRSKTQPEHLWMSEPGIFVGRKARRPSEPVSLAKSQSRERRQLRRLDPSRPAAQSSWPPIAGYQIRSESISRGSSSASREPQDGLRQEEIIHAAFREVRASSVVLTVDTVRMVGHGLFD